MPKLKSKRKYLIYLEKSIEALLSGIDRANSINDKYKTESSLILVTNAWELLAKSLLLKDKEVILHSDGRSLSAEDSVSKLISRGYLKDNEAQHIQQIISLRNAAIHSVLPKIPDEIFFHLQFYCVKFFKDLLVKEFPLYAKQCNKNFLAISFDTFTTYADKVQKLVSKAKRKGTEEQELMWLLERGIRFKGGSYISQNKFEEEVKKLDKKKRLYHHLQVSDFIKDAHMVVIVPVQAPKGYTADINLRKGGSRSASALPVMIKKTDIDTDYPYLTSELGTKVSKNRNYVSKMVTALGMKNNPMYHQSVRSSKSGEVNRYSQKALDFILEKLKKDPSYNPYKNKL